MVVELTGDDARDGTRSRYNRRDDVAMQRQHAQETTMPRIFSPTAPRCWRNTMGRVPSPPLTKLGELRINATGQVLTTQALLAQARGCEIIVSDRQTPGETGVLRRVARRRRIRALRGRYPQRRRRRGQPTRRAGDTRDARLRGVGRRDGARIHRRSRPPRSGCVLEYRAGTEASAQMGRQLRARCWASSATA